MVPIVLKIAMANSTRELLNRFNENTNFTLAKQNSIYCYVIYDIYDYHYFEHIFRTFFRKYVPLKRRVIAVNAALYIQRAIRKAIIRLTLV